MDGLQLTHHHGVLGRGSLPEMQEVASSFKGAAALMLSLLPSLFMDLEPF